MAKLTAGRAVLVFTTLAAIVNGLLAGGNVDRAIVARPAWGHLGLAAWADYTRFADLGNGQVLYPVMAFGGTLLSVLAAVTFLRTGRMPRQALFPIVLAAAVMVVCLPFSFKATPLILGLRRISDKDVAALRDAFLESFFWGRFQMGLHVVGFLANLWTIIAFSWNTNFTMDVLGEGRSPHPSLGRS